MSWQWTDAKENREKKTFLSEHRSKTVNKYSVAKDPDRHLPRLKNPNLTDFCPLFFLQRRKCRQHACFPAVSALIFKRSTAYFGSSSDPTHFSSHTKLRSSAGLSQIRVKRVKEYFLTRQRQQRISRTSCKPQI